MSTLLLVVAAGFFPASAVRAEDDADREFEFAAGLVNLGFPDFAQEVADIVVKRHPDMADRGNLIKAEGLIARRKFNDAEALLKAMGENPKADAIKLALANGYYRFGEIDKAKLLYNDFFGKYTQIPKDPDLLRFYRDSSYRYGQMLEKAGDLIGAVQAYARLLATKPEKEIERRVLCERAKLFVRLAEAASGQDRDKYFKEAAKICDQIQWGGVDIWFGQSVITLANIEIVKGDKRKAQETIKQYNDIFKEIDKMLKEQNLPMSLSPLAGARFLVGQIYQEQGAALAKDAARKDDAIKLLGQALTEFYNVFIKYGDSDWGPQAGAQVKVVEEQLKALGKEVKIDLGAQKDKAITTQFNFADNLFRQKKYQEAITEYLKTLNAFPESDASAKALGALIQAYAEVGDQLMVKTVAEYVGERFSSSTDGATALLALGKLYYDRKDEPMYMYLYDAYLRLYPADNRAAAILFTLGGLKKKAGDEAGATAYFERIIKDYKSDQYYPKALTQLAWGYYQAGEYAKAMEGFRVYVADTQPGPDQVLAQFSLADCYMRMENYTEAAGEFEKLIGWLAPKDNPYSASAADADKNKAVLEKAVFQRANCYARMTVAPDQLAAVRNKASRGFEQLVAIFPQSELAPKALSAKGRIQLELKQYDAAAKTFDDLAVKYPKSEDGKNALFSLARSAMEIKQYDQAVSAFQKMLRNASTYGADEFVRIGQLMVDAAQYPQAIQAFEQAEKMTKDRPILERSLFGRGRAYYEEKQYDNAIRALTDLLTRYPKSGLFYDAKFMLGTAYRDADRLTEAQAALGDVFRYSDDALLNNRASITLGEIQEKGGDLLSALGSYQRVALLADADKPEVRPLVEQAILESIRLAYDLKRFVDVQDSCDQYLKVFPNGGKVSAVRKIKADAKIKASEVVAGTNVVTGTQ
ncbi:MAG: tetratricopeptide repeat protein [bacterium]